MPISGADASADLGPALRAYAQAELARAIACLGWRGARVHEGVHQARKSIRRTRATLRLGSAALGPGWRVADRELQRVLRSLSALRDAQALVETLDRLIGESTAEEARSLLRRARRVAVAARIDAARVALAGDPGLVRRRAALESVRAALPSLAWDRLATQRVRQALADSERAVGKAARRALASDRDSDWHRWRRRARRLSQQQSALSGLLPHLDARRDDKALAILLGQAQDCLLLRAHCGEASSFPESDRRALRKLAGKGFRKLRRKIAALASKAG